MKRHWHTVSLDDWKLALWSVPGSNFVSRRFLVDSRRGHLNVSYYSVDGIVLGRDFAHTDFLDGRSILCMETTYGQHLTDAGMALLVTARLGL